MRSATRVLIDAMNLKPDQGGIRTYTVEIVRQLARSPKLDLVVLTSSPGAFEDLKDDMNVVLTPTFTRRGALRAVWRETMLHRVVRECRAEAVFVPVPELPFRRLTVPTVVVVHDVGPLADPGLFPNAKRFRIRSTLFAASRRTTQVVCVSESTRNALYELTGRNAEHVISEGAREDLRHPAIGGPATPPFVLYVGSLAEHKNVASVIAAFSGEGDDRLILAGPMSERDRRALLRVKGSLGVDGRVSHVGYVSPERLANLYSRASAVVCPSLHEGFGLPALEAMSFGVPVVASAIPASVEVVGDAGVLIDDPKNPRAWRYALDAVLRDDALRIRLADASRARAARFSWSAAGEALVDALVGLVP